MVFTKDFIRDFYRVIQTERVLVLVNNDVDAFCAFRILQYMFRCDQVLFTMVPVDGKQELETAYLEHIEGVKYVLLINCGGTIDIVDILQPEQEVIFFILDSHRPLSVENVYNAVQTRLLLKQEEVAGEIPEYEEIFRDDSDDDDSDEDSDDSSKRKRFDADYIEKRREKRIWEQKRFEVLTKYIQQSHTGASSALTMYEIAFAMSKDTPDLLWLAVVGVSSQFIHRKIDYDHYFERIGILQDHVSRVAKHIESEEGEGDYSLNCLRISFDTDLRIDLYRHWNLYDSMCNSIYTACHFRVWTLKGKNKFHEFLADMGLPLTQCKQYYPSISVNLQNSVKNTMGEHCEKYGLDVNTLFLPAFIASFGYRNKISAIDYVHACASMLEEYDTKKDKMDRVLNAMDALDRGNTDLFQRGLEVAIRVQSVIMEQVQFMLNTGAFVSTSVFIYACITEGAGEAAYFRHPVALERLAHTALETFIASDRCPKRKKGHPLIMFVPLGQDTGSSLLVGIPPIDTIKNDNSRNMFGEVFRQVQRITHCRSSHDFFDSHVITLATEDKTKFLEGLEELLAD